MYILWRKITLKMFKWNILQDCPWISEVLFLISSAQVRAAQYG